MKTFFNIENKYKFEWNDLRAFAMIINVIAIIIFGYAAAYAGFIIAGIGLIKDFSNKNRHINDVVLHLSNIILNLYFFSQL